MNSSLLTRPTGLLTDHAAWLATLSDAALAEVLDSACALVRVRRQQAESALSWLRVVRSEAERRGESA